MRSTKTLKENKENIISDETETQKNKKLNVKITLLTIFFLLFVIFLGIFNQMSQVPEGTKLYKQDIDVVVTEISKSETPRYTGISVIYDYDVDVTVYSKEFNTTEKFSYSDLFHSKYFDLEKGDIIQAELYTYKNESTGEIVKKEINRLY